MGGGAADLLDLDLRERLHENHGNEYQKSPSSSTQPHQQPLYQGEPEPAAFDSSSPPFLDETLNTQQHQLVQPPPFFTDDEHRRPHHEHGHVQQQQPIGQSGFNYVFIYEYPLKMQ
jgi:hypothetical protein